MIPKYSENARILENRFVISNVRLKISFVKIPWYFKILFEFAAIHLGRVHPKHFYATILKVKVVQVLKKKISIWNIRVLLNLLIIFFNLLDMCGKKTEMWYRILSLLQWTIQREFLSFIKCKMRITGLTNALLQMITEHHFQSHSK